MNENRTQIPYRIAITGSIASGKSAVGQQLIDMGFAVIDTDLLTHELLRSPNPAYQAVLARFGVDLAVTPQGPIDRQKLRERAFATPQSKVDLEAIMHPAIEALLRERIKSLAQKAEVVAVQVPLLFEAGLEGQYDEVWCVVVDPKVQLHRLMKRNNLSEQEALARIAKLWTQDDKARRSNRVIDNSGTLEQTRCQTAKCIALAMARARAATCAAAASAGTGVDASDRQGDDPPRGADDRYRGILRELSKVASEVSLGELGRLDTTDHKQAEARGVMEIGSCQDSPGGGVKGERRELQVELKMSVRRSGVAGGCVDGGCRCGCGDKCHRSCSCRDGCGCSCPQAGSSPSPIAAPTAGHCEDGCRLDKRKVTIALAGLSLLVIGILIYVLGFLGGRCSRTKNSVVVTVKQPPITVIVRPPARCCPGKPSLPARQLEPPAPPSVNSTCPTPSQASKDPPDFSLPYVLNDSRSQVSLWSVVYQPGSRGAIVFGKDAAGRVVVRQEYGPNLLFLQQWVFHYGSFQCWVDRFDYPDRFLGRTIYQYSAYGKLLQARRMDASQSPVIIAQFLRNESGQLLWVVVRRFSNGQEAAVHQTHYQPDPVVMTDEFYFFNLFGQFQ